MNTSISLGEYYNTQSPLHACDPRLKLVITLSYVVSCIFVSTLPELILAGSVLVLSIIAARVPISLVFKQLKVVLFLMLFTSCINLFFIQSGTVLVEFAFLRITFDGVLFALLYTARFAFLISASILLLLTTTQSELCSAVEKLCSPLAKLGVPVQRLVFTLSLALHFVPILTEEFYSIKRAQATRGAVLDTHNPFQLIKSYTPLLIPLLASCLRHAENLSRAMEARCYMVKGTRSSYHQFVFNPKRDGLFCVLFLIYVGILIVM